jgi:RNA polymerase sigma factor (TIGR02999 family)
MGMNALSSPMQNHDYSIAMPPSPGPSVTALLERARQGDRDALGALLPLVYDELRRIARGQMRRERPGQTLNATGLVHEAWLRLSASSHLAPHNRPHFLAIAANVMRQILVEHARARHAAKRGGHRERVTLNEGLAPGAAVDVDVIALDEALEKLAALDPQQATLVELRYFGGLSVEETAETLGISPATVKRRWSSARAFLAGELAGL